MISGKRVFITGCAKFVAEKWSCRKSAEAYLKLLSGNIPDSWWFQPSRMRYACGYGLSREQLKQNIQLLTGKYGMESLCLGNKPGILEYYSELIKNDKEQ